MFSIQNNIIKIIGMLSCVAVFTGCSKTSFQSSTPQSSTATSSGSPQVNGNGSIGTVTNPQPNPSASSSSAPTPSPSVSSSSSGSLPQPNPSSSASSTPGPLPSASSTITTNPQPNPSSSGSSPSPSPSASSNNSSGGGVGGSSGGNNSGSGSSGSGSTGGSQVVCDAGTVTTAAQFGIKGSLYTSTVANSDNVEDMISAGSLVTDSVYLSQLYVPTTNFTNGFMTTDGNYLKDNNGNLLIEYFALDLKSQLTLGPNDEPGTYQIALLADDGAVLSMQQSNGQMQVIVNDDGTHPTKMGCTDSNGIYQTVTLNSGDVIPFELKYYQGPRYQIALTMIWRKVSATDQESLQDPLCNAAPSNTDYWDPNSTPSAPGPNWIALQQRGWQVPGPQNFLLQAAESNPCSVGTMACNSYVALTGEDIDVPARDATNTCYYTQLLSETPYQSSEDYTQMRDDITAADHDGLTPHPRILGSTEIGFSLLGARNVVVAEDPQGTVNMFVDNFFLYEIETMYGLNILGFGTADSIPQGGSMTVQVDGQAVPVNFTSFAPEGEATVPPVDLTQQFPVGQSIIFRASGLDCGVLGQTSNAYIVFK